MTDARTKAARIWLAVLLVTAIAVMVSFKHLDKTVLNLCWPLSNHLANLGKGLVSAVLLTVEALVFLELAIMRMLRGTISPFGKALAAACVSSICAYAINASVLKVMFGVMPPGYVMTGWPHHVLWFHGTPDSSFPSGHMALAGAFV